MYRNTNDYRNTADAYNGSINHWPRRPRRLLLFTVVFLPLLLLTQIFIFLQPAVYSSKATVLTVAPTDIDASSSDADPQHVNIQKQILIGQSLLEQTVEKLREKNDTAHLTVDNLKTMLSVEPVESTNIVQLFAEGDTPIILQSTINVWIESYLNVRAQYISETTEKATAAIKNEITRIEREVETKRKQLDSFGMAHDISSQDSQDNQAHARLQGLNHTLNAALEEEVKTKAKFDTVREAIAQGKSVVPDSDSQSLAEMTKSAQLLREKVDDIQSQYTPEYIQLNPKLNIVTKELAELEKKISKKLQFGGEFAMQEAENNYAAARQAVKAIKLQMEGHKQKIAEYTSQFSKYQAMQEELVKLEELQQKTKQRLIEIEVKQREQYPQVDVVDWASLPSKPIRPNYLLQSVLAFATCLSLGLFAVWIAEYLNREETTQVPITLSGIHLYHNGAGRDALELQNSPEKIYHDPPIKVLPQDAPRELALEEIKVLFSVADRQTVEILCLLFNGLSADEIIHLTESCFDLENKSIKVPLRDSYVAMNKLAISLFTPEALQGGLQNAKLSTQEMDALLTCTAIDSGLPFPEQINTELVRFTYMLYLVRQGIKFAHLAKIFGTLSSSRLLELGRFSPGHAGIPIEEIDLDYPLDI